MARLNIEERCFAGPNIRKLARLMKWDELKATGCLAWLWHDSQTLLQTHCSVTDIEIWCKCRNSSDAERLTRALVESGWLVEEGPDRFYIDGNRKQVDALIALKEGAKAGGEANRKKWEQRKSLKNGTAPPEPRAIGEQGAQPQPTRSPIQCNAIQGNAIQDNALKTTHTSEANETETVGEPPVESDDSTRGAAQPELIPSGKKEPKSTSKVYPPDSHPLGRLWNQHRGALPEIKNLNETRLKHARARWAEQPDEGYWTEIIKRISASKFCNGSGERGWRATIDFLLQPLTHIKTIEGQYDDRERNGIDRSTYAQKRTSNNQALAAKVMKGEL